MVAELFIRTRSKRQIFVCKYAFMRLNDGRRDQRADVCTCGRLLDLPKRNCSGRDAPVERPRRVFFPTSVPPTTPSRSLDLPATTPLASIYVPQRLAIVQSDSPPGKGAAVCGDIGLKVITPLCRVNIASRPGSLLLLSFFPPVRTVLHAYETR